MSITLILDSASDYCVEHHTLSVPFVIIPLNITFKDDHYLDGVDISMDEFYERMAKEESLPKTSQPSPQAFYDVFLSELDKGNELIYLGLSSNLSGTVQSAGIAKGMLDETVQNKVHIIDTGTASAGIHVLLKEAEKLVQEGKNAVEIVASINEKKQSILGYVLLETLENVKKGGRISAVQGAVAEFLNIKPLLSVQNGIVGTVGKYRGKKKGLNKLMELLHDWKQKHPEKELFIIHSLPSKEDVIKEFGDLFSFHAFKSISFTRFGSTIGTYASENAIGFIFH